MSGKLYIRDTQILRDLGSAIGRFSAHASQMMHGIDQEIRQINEVIDQRVYYWERLVQNAYRAVQAAEIALRHCQASGYTDRDGHYHHPDCSADMHSLQTANRFLNECKHNLNKTKEWRSKVEQGLQTYYREARGFQSFLQSQSQDATQFLSRAAAKYEAVHQSTGGSGSSNIGSFGGSVIGPASTKSEPASSHFGEATVLGPYAAESIPARGPERNWTDEEIAEVDRIGRTYGCHTCGSKDPGPNVIHFCLDHQPATEINFDHETQRLYPQCSACSHRQGGEVKVVKDTVYKLLYYKIMYGL